MTRTLIQKKGTMFIFSGPSGCGKSSVIKGVMKNVDKVKLSVSVTTREKREGETEGKDYYFISENEFKQLVAQYALYEYVDSDFGPKYGTPKAAVDELLAKGEDVILDLDYPGVQQLRRLAGDRVQTIFLMPPSLRVLKDRLINRGTDAEDVIARRMSMAEKRIKESVFYDFIVVNDKLEDAIADVEAIIKAIRLKKENVIELDKVIENVVREN
ncbi:MAG: guanylate kinase [Alphaproteobacteria bacterium]|nr:guanylate kinase [Alphaproteobacteria bacterium]